MADPPGARDAPDSDPAWHYFFILWLGDTIERPRGMVRRRTVDGHHQDQASTENDAWKATASIRLNDIGMYDHDLIPVATEVALAQLDRWRAGIDTS